MPRFPRKNLKTNYFHVITQGINKEYIFEKSEDKRYYIASLYKSNKKYNVKIIAYCIMDNHVHLLIRTKNIEDLSKYMHVVNTKYGKYYNEKHKRVGYVFRNRFKSEGIYEMKHLYNCINYIFNNPVKAQMCNKPEEYPYSNYKRTYNVENENDSFIDVDDCEDDRDDDTIISEYLVQNGIKHEDLLDDAQVLKNVIVELKNKKNVSLRSVSKILNINREYIRKKYKE